jgi:NAD(P)-dependent dehydrogenase (short-subunit alcohol dehydrogenase family)
LGAPQTGDLTGVEGLSLTPKRNWNEAKTMNRLSVSTDETVRFDLDGQIALVTGAARGIGRACALALAAAGAHVALGLRDVDDGAELVAAIEALGRRALALQMDVTRRVEITDAVAAATRHFGRLDILVNNAGIGPPNPAEVVTEADFDHTVAVNLKGTFFVTQEVGRAMIAQSTGGKIVNLSSQAGFVALPTESVYCMTKAAIAHLTKCFALEWGKHRINVNAVAPTFIRTPGTVKWLQDDAFRSDLLARIPLGRVGEPIDVAGAVVFLASPAAAMITGATLLIDGGFTLR